MGGRLAGYTPLTTESAYTPQSNSVIPIYLLLPLKLKCLGLFGMVSAIHSDFQAASQFEETKSPLRTTSSFRPGMAQGSSRYYR